MVPVYSTYEAKAKFSEVMRRVRAGQRVVISYRGREIAVISPIGQDRASLEHFLEELEGRGILSRYEKTGGELRPLAKRPGALARFLESRE